MRLISANKIIAFILLLGFSIGSWRFSHGAGRAGSGEGVVEIRLLTTETKANWVVNQVYSFNYLHPKIHVTFQYVEARDAMDSILYGKQQPTLWSPDSPLWIARIDDLWQQKHGQHLVNQNDPSSSRVFLRSPLVFLTTKRKAAYFTNLLGQPGAWDAIRKLSLGQQTPPWGTFRFAHANPLSSNSGVLTLAMIMNSYTAGHNYSGSMSELPNDPKFIAYLSEVERGLHYDAASESGTFALTKAFVADPSIDDFIVTHESAALEAAAKNPDLAVIYPNPTAVSEESVCVLDGPWVTPTQQAAAHVFMDYLNRPTSLRDALNYNMRPASGPTEISLTSKLNEFQMQGFRETYNALELPSYDALNLTAFQWKKDFVHQAKK